MSELTAKLRELTPLRLGMPLVTFKRPEPPSYRAAISALMGKLSLNRVYKQIEGRTYSSPVDAARTEFSISERNSCDILKVSEFVRSAQNEEPTGKTLSNLLFCVAARGLHRPN
jgi:hypothetical protein